MANAPNPERAKRFIDFLLRTEVQKLLGTNLSRHGEATADREIPSADKIKPMEGGKWAGEF
jgi:ABC-type Fe3+ transport system substrate-binding protein